MPIPTMVWTYRSTTSTTTTSLNRSSDPRQNQRDLRQSGGLLAFPSSSPLSCISLQLIDVRTRTEKPNQPTKLTPPLAIRMHRILITGNSGSGKSTMAAQVAAEYGLPHLDLD